MTNPIAQLQRALTPMAHMGMLDPVTAARPTVDVHLGRLLIRPVPGSDLSWVAAFSAHFAPSIIQEDGMLSRARLLIDTYHWEEALQPTDQLAGELAELAVLSSRTIALRWHGPEGATLREFKPLRWGGSEGAEGDEKETKFQSLLTQLKSDKDPDARGEAAERLGRLRDPEAVEPLIEAFGDEEEMVKFGAVIGLVELGDPAVKPLIRAMKQARDDGNENVMILAHLTLYYLYIIALDDPDWEKRLVAARYLGKTGGPEVVAPLIRALEDENPIVNAEVSIALGKLGDHSVDALHGALRHKSFGVRLAAASVLGELSFSRSFEPLIQALRDEDNDLIKLQLATALFSLGDSRATLPLLALEDKELIRLAASTVLLFEYSEDPKAQKLLDDILKIPLGKKLRAAIRKALSWIGEQRAKERSN